MDELYKQNEEMIKHLSWSFTKKYRLKEYDETLSTANLIFCEVVASNKFNPEKSCFSTYLNMQLCGKLNNWCKNEYSRREKEILCSSMWQEKKYTEQYEDQIYFKDVLNKFSDAEKEIIDFILNPDEVKSNRRKITKNKLKKELMKKKNMSYSAIDTHFKNIQVAFAL